MGTDKRREHRKPVVGMIRELKPRGSFRVNAGLRGAGGCAAVPVNSDCVLRRGRTSSVPSSAGEEFVPGRSVQYRVHMKTLTYTAARENLAKTMQQVCEDHAAVVITRRRDQAVVMMSLEDYESLEETAYLLRSPRNAQRLREAVDQLRSGEGTERELPELA